LYFEKPQVKEFLRDKAGEASRDCEGAKGERKEGCAKEIAGEARRRGPGAIRGRREGRRRKSRERDGSGRGCAWLSYPSRRKASQPSGREL